MATIDSTPSHDDIQRTLDRFACYLYARCGLSDTTATLNLGFARRIFGRFGRAALTHDDYEQYVTELRLKKASYAHVCNACTAVERLSDFAGDPIRLGRPKKPERMIVGVMSEAEVAVIISRAKTLRERALLTLLAYSGIRNRELIGVRVQDVDIANQMVAIQDAKGQKRRTVCVAGACVQILVDYMRERKGNPEDYLFVTLRRGQKLQTQDIRKMIRVAAKRAGITRRIYPHLFRHSLATAMLHRGAGLMTIKEQLGHEYATSTLVYIHSSKERLQAEYRMFVPSFV